METPKMPSSKHNSNHNFALNGGIVERMYEIASSQTEKDKLMKAAYRYFPSPRAKHNFIPSALIPKFAREHKVTMSYLICGHDPGESGGVRITDWSVQSFQQIVEQLRPDEIQNVRNFLSFFRAYSSDFDPEVVKGKRRCMQFSDIWLKRVKEIFRLFPYRNLARKEPFIPKEVSEYYKIPYDEFYQRKSFQDECQESLGFMKYSVSRLSKMTEFNNDQMIRVDPLHIVAVSEVIGTTPCLFFNWEPVSLYSKDPLIDILISDFLCIPLDLRVFIVNILSVQPQQILQRKGGSRFA